tara:strand:- start:671 stop:1126 length:456 start_codon:yes stop_codon:yes gene_type:complete
MIRNIHININCFIIISTLLVIDQFLKNFINTNYNKLINKDLLFFTLEYVKNNGAAFNILSGNRLLLSCISILSSIILIYLIFIKENNLVNKYGFSFILAGSLGNGLDRIIDGYVIDFIKIRFINFPVFNLADLSINLGVLILIIGYLKYKT